VNKKKLLKILTRWMISVLLSISFLNISGCAAHSNIEPLGKNNISANFSIGGPIVAAFDTHIPVPYATVGINYGYTESFDLNGTFHLLPLPYGILGMDVGATWFPSFEYNSLIPTIGIQPRIMALACIKSDIPERFRIYPLISTTAAWIWCCGAVYTGFDATIPLSSADYDNETNSIIVSPYLGYRWNLGRNTHLFTELKWHGANIESDKLAVDYIEIGGYGAITPLISIERGF